MELQSPFSQYAAASWMLAPLVIALILTSLYTYFRESDTSRATLHFSLLLGAMAVHLERYHGAWLLVLALAALLLIWRGRGAIGEVAYFPHVGGGPLWVLPVLTALLMLALLLPNLGSYARTLLTWEGETVGGFLDAYRRGESVREFTLARLRWGQGLMSSGYDSFSFGAPAYLLFHLRGFDTVSLRLPALVLHLSGVPFLYLLVRRQVSAPVASLAALVFLLSPATWYYTRYGTSLGATVATAILATYLLSVWLTERSRRSAWLTLLVGGALFLGTLHYATGRLVTLGLLLVWLGQLAREVPRKDWRQLRYHALLALALVAVLLVQRHWGGLQSFVQVRGEQVFHFLQDPYYHREFLGSRDGSAGELTREEKVRLVARVLEMRVRELARIFRPSEMIPDEPGGLRLIGDPPRLALSLPVLVPFVVVGMCVSLVRWRALFHQILLVWCVFSLAPLLLTTRVDIHRAYIVVVPLSVWAALGISAWLRASHSSLTTFLQGGTLLLLWVLGVYSTYSIVRPDIPPDQRCEEVKAALAADDSLPIPTSGLDATCRWWLELERVRKGRAHVRAAETLSRRHQQ